MIEMESPLEPELPICDAHHHLWERPPSGYMLNDLLQDLRAGHNIVSTVAVECRYGYRTDGAHELKPVGEVEFLESIADRVATDATIKPRIAAAVVGHANLLLGDAVAPVLKTAMKRDSERPMPRSSRPAYIAKAPVTAQTPKASSVRLAASTLGLSTKSTLSPVKPGRSMLT